jgi:hypothetical protein
MVYFFVPHARAWIEADISLRLDRCMESGTFISIVSLRQG